MPMMTTRRPRTVWTPEMDARLVAGLAAREPRRQIADALGVPDHVVGSRIDVLRLVQPDSPRRKAVLAANARRKAEDAGQPPVRPVLPPRPDLPPVEPDGPEERRRSRARQIIAALGVTGRATLNQLRDSGWKVEYILGVIEEAPEMLTVDQAGVARRATS